MVSVLVYLEPADEAAARRAGRTWHPRYVTEVLAHAGFTFSVVGRDQLREALGRHNLLVLPYAAPLDAEAREAIAAFARHGGVLGIGGTSGLDALFGVRTVRPLAEAYGRVVAADAITSGVSSSLHCWGGSVVQLEAGTTALTQGEEPSGNPAGPLICRAPHAVLLAADVLRAIVHIQQGHAISQDGPSAPDGSASIEDGILKTDDGFALDWARDRGAVEGHPCFLEPVGDDWRDLIIRSLLSLAVECGVALPVLWYWPEDVPAVGLLSHDTDGNVEALAWQELEAAERSGIRSSWCCIRYPETYSAAFYRAVVERGHEACLHYDAHSASYPDSTFSQASFAAQLRWLRELLPGAAIVSNKNHYLRWEGWTEPWRWMEEGGITVDQCKGPSKSGNCGFLFGGSHPWFPLDDAEHGSRLLDVLEINLFAQDQVVACPPAFAEPFLQRTRRRGGVAHFLFHPAHVAKPGVADAMAHTISMGRQLGMPWWTSDQIGRWERARRKVRLELRAGHLQAEAMERLEQATVLVLDATSAGNQPPAAGWERVERWGFPFWRVVATAPFERPFRR